jgi:protease I
MKSTQSKSVLIPIPQTDFDPTEVAVPWKILTTAGHRVVFATPEGRQGSADPKIISGDGLGIFKSMLVADKNGRLAYTQLQDDEKFKNPMPYEKLKPENFDALILPGGHAPGMKPYLESRNLQTFVGDFFDQEKIVGAICHGVLLAARSISKSTGKSVLWGKKTTALPAFMELSAWRLTRYRAGDYYRTYPKTVQQEVTESLKDPADFIRGPMMISLRSILRDSPKNIRIGFTVKDGNYLSARWPGDAHRFAKEIAEMLSV